MKRGGVLRAALCAAVLGSMTVPAAAQDAGLLLPTKRWVRTPVGDPHATRIGVAVMTTNLLATQGPERPPFTLPDPEDSAADVVAGVSLGVVLPLLSVAEWEGGGAMLVADAKVFSRFRLEYEGRDDMGQDWYVGGGVEARRDRLSGRAAITHRSSHIGDEFALATGAERIEFGSEQLDVLAGFDLPLGGRVYGGGSWIFRSYLDWEPRLAALDFDDRFVVQAGADRHWKPWQDQRFGAWLGVDVQAAERTDWDLGYGVAAGIGVAAHRSLRLMVRFYDGYSPMGEFFLTPERFYAFELVADI